MIALLRNMLKGISGEYEIGRTLLAGSGLSAITTPIGFQSWDMAMNGAHFDVAAWCVAYPAGLAALGGIGVFAIGKKDKAVAAAKVTHAELQNPKQVEVVNTSNNPVPTEDIK